MNRNSLPPFKNGVRVVHYLGGARIDVKHNEQRCGVDVLDDDLGKPLSVLNDMIVGWPQHPITSAQVRDFV